MSKRTLFVSLLTLILAVGICTLIGCPKPQPTEEGGPPPGMLEGPEGTQPPEAKEPTGEPVKIGAIFSVTGAASPLGEPEKRTAQMIEQQVNENGGVLGRPLEVIIKDDESIPDKATLAAKDLINEEVCAIVGPSRTPCTMPLIDPCTEAKVPLISCAAGRGITEPVKEWVFAVPQPDTLAVERILDYVNEQGITKVASLYVANAFGESGQGEIDRLTQERDIELVASESFGGEDTDMTPQLKKIQQKDPEAVICWGTNPGPAIVAKNMKKLGMEIPLLQSHGVANQKFIELAGDAAEGVMLPAGRLLVWKQVAEDHPQKEVLTDFAQAYEEKYEMPVDTFAGHAYDALHIAIGALERAETDDTEKLRDAIEQTQDFVGTAGVFNFSADDHRGLTSDAFVWVKVEDGEFKIAQ